MRGWITKNICRTYVVFENNTNIYNKPDNVKEVYTLFIGSGLASRSTVIANHKVGSRGVRLDLVSVLVSDSCEQKCVHIVWCSLISIKLLNIKITINIYITLNSIFTLLNVEVKNNDNQ